MATKSPSDFEFQNVSVASKPKSRDVKVQSFIWSKPRDANDIMVYSQLRNKQWIHLNEFIESIQWTDSLDAGGFSARITLSNEKTKRGRRISDYVQRGTKIILFFKTPFNEKVEEVTRMTVWDRERTSSSDEATLNIVCYDQMKHLIESKATFLFRNRSSRRWSANEMTRKICRSQGIPIRRLPKAKRNIRYFYAESESIFDTLVRIWTLESKRSGRKFRIRMVKGKLEVTVKPKRPKSRVLEVVSDGEHGTLIAASHKDSLEGVYTSIRLHGVASDASEAEERNSAIKSKPYKNKRAVALYGRIHYEETVRGVTSKSKLNSYAKRKLRELSKITRTATVELIGMPFLVAGSAIRITDHGSGLAGIWYFKSVDHDINGDGDFVTKGELVNYDYTLELDTDESNLKQPSTVNYPDVENTNDFLFDPNQIAPAPLLGSTTMPRLVRHYILMACTVNGPSGVNYPIEWADDPSLAALLQGESSFNWTAQNPTSTAYGLFQFLDQTWAGTGVSKRDAEPPTARSPWQRKRPIPGRRASADSWRFWMCYAGLIYIQKRYGSPSRAYSHWLAQNPHWY